MRHYWSNHSRYREWISLKAFHLHFAPWWWFQLCWEVLAGIESLVEALEVRFLGNRDKHLHFALLTDFNDAPTEHMPEDEALLTLAQ